MMSDASILIDQLSNFYKTYSYNEEFIPGLFQCYIDSITMLEDYTKQVETNINSSECESFRVIPYASTETNMWEYSINDVIVSSKFPDYKDLTEAISIWSSMTADEKVVVLEDLGRYLQIDLSSGINNTNAKIIFLNLYDWEDELLIDGIDYKLTNNKIYPINENISMSNNKIVLREIIIDYNYTYKRSGVFLGKEYTGVISRQEYRDTNLAFMEAAAKGPEVVNLENALGPMFEGENFNFIDIGMKNSRKKFLWEDGLMSPFDFIVNVPSSYSESVKRVDLFTEYIKIVKPSDTNFLINWVVEKTDPIPLLDSIAFSKIKIEVIDNPLDTDFVEIKTIHNEDNALLFGELNALDSMQYVNMDFDNVYFDIYNDSDPRYKTYYDYSDINMDEGIMYDMGRLEGAIYDGIVSAPMITYKTFPEYPLNFSVTSGVGYAIISFKNNSIGCTGYRVFKDEVELQLMDIIPATMGTGEMITRNDTTTGQHSYEIRSYYKPFITESGRIEYSISPKTITVTI